MSTYDYKALEPGLNQLWPTPVMLHKLQAGSTDAVAIEVMTTMDLDAPAGEKMGNNILRNPGPALAAFRDEVIVPTFEMYLNEAYGDSISNYGSYKMQAWLTGTGLNYGMPPHEHSGSQVTAVFYILAEEEKAGGEIGLMDPRNNACRGYGGKMRDQFKNHQHLPKTGDVLIMPSFLYHYVVIYKSKLRLAIPVDLFLMSE